MLSVFRTVKILTFMHRNKQWHTFGWYWRNGYFSSPKPHYYIDGYKDGSQSHSWAASLFLPSQHNLTLDTKLSHKQLKEAGFVDWLGKETPKLDYYILRRYQ